MTAALFLVVDAIPHPKARGLWEEGRMPGFCEPRPVISVFPSLTNVAVPALLRGVFDDVRPPGYEARHYHPPTGEIRGGFRFPESEPGLAPYHDHPEGTLQHLAVYVLRSSLVTTQARWIGHRLKRSDEPWLGYVAATDGVGHFAGEERLREAFGTLCDRVVEAADAIERDRGERPTVVLCSDHGLAFGRLEHLDAGEIERRLRLVGFHQGRVGGAGFVLVPLGDVGGGAAWCRPQAAPELAEAVAELPGVDVTFAVTSDGARAFAVREDGMAIANLRTDGRRVGYEPVTGDPLGLLPAWDSASSDGRWATDEAMLAATLAHRYPDALHRVLGGFRDIVDHPGQVLFSMDRGWTWGPRLTSVAARLVSGQVGTHGALSADQSLGFAAARGGAEDAPWPASPMRPEAVFAPFADAVRAGAAAREPRSV